MVITIKKSDRKGKKFMALIPMDDDTIKKIHFGAKGYQHYTEGHLDDARKERYIKRHEKREKHLWTHTRKNILTSAYWSRWFTWQFKTYKEARKFIEDKQNIDIQ